MINDIITIIKMILEGYREEIIDYCLICFGLYLLYGIISVISISLFHKKENEESEEE